MKNSIYIFSIQVFCATMGMFLGFMENSIFPFLVLVYPLIVYHLTITTKQFKQLVYKIAVLSTIVCFVNLYWVAFPLMEIGKLSLFFAYIVVLALSMGLALFPVFFSYCLFHISLAQSSAMVRIFFAGTMWTILEYLQSFVFTGFPWLTLPASLAQWTPVLAILSITGTYLYAGILVCATASLYEALYRKIRVAYIVFIIIVCTTAGITYVAYETEIPEGLPLNIASIQGNIPQSEKWSTEHALVLKKYISLTEEALAVAEKNSIKLNLIIWPETALPFLLTPKAILTTELTDFVEKNEVSLLTGAIRYGGNTKENIRLIYNSAHLYSPQGTLLSWYDKEKLVPFGEYTPFFLTSLVDIMNVQHAGQFSAGYDNSMLSVQNIPFGTLICYEILFPTLAQREVSAGANFLINISNDAWFGYTRAAWQHLQHARLRSIEQGRYLVRATNTGISAVINPKGVVEEKTALFADAFLLHTIYTQTQKTVYHYIAPYIFLFSICLALFIFFIQRIRTTKFISEKKIIRRTI